MNKWISILIVNFLVCVGIYAEGFGFNQFEYEPDPAPTIDLSRALSLSPEKLTINRKKLKVEMFYEKVYDKDRWVDVL
ncbi:hypothetical protein [Treponema sp. J25]|uniref:hypothetical protein n=1 Tax=Treponema sp. J25 TaxID=2094121 RepID=UPI001047BBB4|nr:hypothetical protein [Treponema sp. J25]TCW62102.1 hypothetical protein C5O22_03445 [Treponema sp. J25]